MPYSKVPHVRISDFRRGLQTFSPWLKEDPNYFRKLTASTTIVDQRKYLWLIADTGIVPRENGPVVACGRVERIGTIHALNAEAIYKAGE